MLSTAFVFPLFISNCNSKRLRSKKNSLGISSYVILDKMDRNVMLDKTNSQLTFKIEISSIQGATFKDPIFHDSEYELLFVFDKHKRRIFIKYNNSFENRKYLFYINWNIGYSRRRKSWITIRTVKLVCNKTKSLFSKTLKYIPYRKSPYFTLRIYNIFSRPKTWETHPMCITSITARFSRNFPFR